MSEIRKNIVSFLAEESIKDSVWKNYLDNSVYVEIKEETILEKFLSERISHADYSKALEMLCEVVAKSIEHGVRSAVPLTLQQISGEVA